MEKSFAKVFCLVKDESELIEDFIVYHGSLFGFENIIIIDNGSTRKDVLEVYDKYRPYGIIVDTDLRSMSEQGLITTHYMLKYKDTCEWMFPLDADEFLFAEQSDKIGFEDIKTYLDDRPDFISAVFYSRILNSVPDPTHTSWVDYANIRPARNITRFYTNIGACKVIVRANVFVGICDGNHDANVDTGAHEISPKIGLLHFHNTGARSRFNRAFAFVVSQNKSDIDLTPSMLPELIQSFAALFQKQHLAGGHCYHQVFQIIVRMFTVYAWQSEHDGHLPPVAAIHFADNCRGATDIIQRIRAYCKEGASEGSDGSRGDINALVFGVPTDADVQRDDKVECAQVATALKNYDLPVSILPSCRSLHEQVGGQVACTEWYGGLPTNLCKIPIRYLEVSSSADERNAKGVKMTFASHPSSEIVRLVRGNGSTGRAVGRIDFTQVDDDSFDLCFYATRGIGTKILPFQVLSEILLSFNKVKHGGIFILDKIPPHLAKAAQAFLHASTNSLEITTSLHTRVFFRKSLMQ